LATYIATSALRSSSSTVPASSENATPTLLPVRSFAEYLHWSYEGQALCLFAFTLGLPNERWGSRSRVALCRRFRLCRESLA
jgi:predicted RNase H-like nuclease